MLVAACARCIIYKCNFEPARHNFYGTHDVPHHIVQPQQCAALARQPGMFVLRLAIARLAMKIEPRMVIIKYFYTKRLGQREKTHLLSPVK